MSDLLLLGLNHTLAPVEVRERLAFPAERLTVALRELAGRLAAEACTCEDAAAEVVILSTCNRTEIYAWAAGDAAGTVRRFLAERSGLDECTLAGYLYARCGDDAGRHLLRVAAGLDSLVVGENEILGQVKDACEAAHAAATRPRRANGCGARLTSAGPRCRWAPSWWRWRRRCSGPWPPASRC